MRIAVASDNGIVSQHFGHCQGFALYDVEDGQIKEKGFAPNPGHQPGILPVFLSEHQANIIIAGGMGEMARKLFNERNINVVVGAAGNCYDVINEYLEGKLIS